MYITGRALVPPTTTLATLSYFYLSYNSHTSSTSPFTSNTASISYLVAGLLSIGVMPFTLGIVMPTNNKLMRKAEEMSALEKEDEVVEVGLGEETAHKLVDNWGVLNLVGGLMFTGSAVLGLWTALSN